MDRLLFMPVNINKVLTEEMNFDFIKRNCQNNDLICCLSLKRPDFNPAKYLRVIIGIKLIQGRALLRVFPFRDISSSIHH